MLHASCWPPFVVAQLFPLTSLCVRNVQCYFWIEDRMTERNDPCEINGPRLRFTISGTQSTDLPCKRPQYKALPVISLVLLSVADLALCWVPQRPCTNDGPRRQALRHSWAPGAALWVSRGSCHCSVHHSPWWFWSTLVSPVMLPAAYSPLARISHTPTP